MNEDWDKLESELKEEGFNNCEEYLLSEWDNLSESHKILLQSVGIKP